MTPVPVAKRPTHGYVRVGKTNIRVKIDWEWYDNNNGRSDQFKVDSFHKSMIVKREQLKFAA